MNIFEEYKDKIISILKKAKEDNLLILPDNLNSVNVDSTPPKIDFDISTNVSMVLAKPNNKSPNDLALILIDILKKEDKSIEEISFAKPGFINIKFNKDFWSNFTNKLISSPNNYGSSNKNKKKYLVEFVSANPTGPLHVGHCRGAILGDSLSNLLIFNGNKITREYYVNDAGGQINNFVTSVYYRILEKTTNKPFPSDQDLYPGNYITDIAEKIIKNKTIKNFNNFNKIYNTLKKEALKYSMQLVMQNLKLLGVKHNNFIHESKLIDKKIVSKAIKKLQNKKYIYKGKLAAPKGEEIQNWKSRDQLLFKSTIFGDEIDRPLTKADGSWTYFASDIAYHSNKISRKYDVLINILGADHSGYIKRITSAVKAMSENKINLICKVSQLVKLFKNGEPYKMSKRKGDYVTVEDLVNEVGKDSTRFMMLNRGNDVELDFDFQKVTEKSKDNPVFYVQYAYARINSIFRMLNLKLKTKIKLKDVNFNLNEHELKILKKISEWPKCVELSSSKLEPHRIPFYLYELVTIFHSYWNLGKANKEFRFISDDNKLNKSRLVLIQALAIVINNGMTILGVSTPSSM